MRVYIINADRVIVVPQYPAELSSGEIAVASLEELRAARFPSDACCWSRAGSLAGPGFSPLAACWTSELGALNRFTHIWVYKDLNERARVREESRRPGGAWPPQAGVRPIRQENKLLIPASFSPVR